MLGKAKEAAKIMKWMDPNIELIACGSCTNEEGHKTFGDWDLKVIEETYDYIDYISIHRYYNYNPEKMLAYPSVENESDIPFFFRDLTNYIDTITNACDFVKGKNKKERQIDISFDEWGVVTDTGAVPGGVKQDYKYANFKELDAIIYGGLLCTFLNNANRVKIACQSLLVNEGGMITTSPEGKAIRQTTFYPFQDVAKYGRGVALKGIEDFPKKHTDHHGEQETVVCSSVYNEETKEINIFIVNCDMEEDVLFQLELQSFNDLEGIMWRELYSENPYARNTFEDEFNVIPIEKSLSNPKNGEIEIKIKKHSWNVLRFKEK